MSTLATFEAKTASRRIKFYWGATSRNTLSAGTSFSGLEGTLRGKDPDQRNFYIFSIWTFEKGRQQRTFYSRRCKRKQELELYFTSPWGTARPIIWFNGRPFWSNGEGFKSFFSGLRRCKCRCASSDKLLSKKPAKLCRNPAKILFAGRSPTRWITPDFLPLQHIRGRLGDLYNQRHRYSMVSISVILVSLKCQS